MPAYVTDRIAEALNVIEKSVRGSKVLVLGVTYKPDVGDVRESAAIHVMSRLSARGADLSFHDPFIERVQEGTMTIDRVELGPAVIAGVDLVALLTPHSTYDLDAIVEQASLVFDARNAIGAARPNVVVL